MLRPALKADCFSDSCFLVEVTTGRDFSGVVDQDYCSIILSLLEITLLSIEHKGMKSPV